MALLFDTARWLHIAAGFTALILFWIPMVVRKGGKAHNRVGWAYVVSMSVVSVSALYMGVYRIFLEPDGDGSKVAFSWFLIFISILSSASAWYGIRVLRIKQRTQAHSTPIDLLFPGLLLISGVGVSIYGFTLGHALLQYFPIIGIVLGFSHLAYWLSVPKQRKHWIIEHIGGMMSCCIATVTAFTVFGAPRLLNISSLHLIVWVLPSLVMVPLSIGFTRYYRKKFNPTTPS